MPTEKDFRHYDRMIRAIPGGAKMQDWIIDVGGRKSAMIWLQILSVCESIFFPVPIDPLLAMVVMAREAQYIRIAIYTSLTSIVGAVIGWLGAFYAGNLLIAIGWVDPAGTYAEIVDLFAVYGSLVIFVGALTPLPYKLVVLGAGFLAASSGSLAALVPFILISLVGRILRYGLVAAIVRYRRDTVLATTLTIVLAGLFAFFWWFLQT